MVYAVDNNNQLTTVIQNSNDINQLWTITPTTDSADNQVYNVMPYVQKVTGVDYALQYENGKLTFRPYDNTYTAQQWLASTSTFDRGIPIVNVSPAAIYTPEFAPVGNFAPGTNTALPSLDSKNNQQVADVVNLIKQSVQQYMTQLNAATQGTGQISSSSLGNAQNPLSVNIMLNKQGSGSKSTFADVPSSGAATSAPITSTDVIALLDQYEEAQNPHAYDNYRLYKKSDLEMALQKLSPLSAPDAKDYISKRIGTCNCKL
jgi:hypothetical protein